MKKYFRIMLFDRKSLGKVEEFHKKKQNKGKLGQMIVFCAIIRK